MLQDNGMLFAWAARTEVAQERYVPTATALYELANAWKREGRKAEAREARDLAAAEAIREEARVAHAEVASDRTEVAA